MTLIDPGSPQEARWPTVVRESWARARELATRSRNGSARIVMDPAGVWWILSEQPDPGDRSRWSLVAESLPDGERRRAASYPEAWMRLEPEELVRLIASP